MDIPPSKLNRIPEGLMSFFDMKALGAYPQALTQQLLGTMDLTRFYSDIAASEGLATFTALVANTATTTFPILTTNWVATGTDFSQGSAVGTFVPQNEIWMLLESTVSWALTTAGNIADFTLVTRTTPSSAEFLLTDGPQQGFINHNIGAAVTCAGRRCLTRPVLLMPGTELRVLLYGATWMGGTISYTVSARIRRLTR